jgi:hypothetical protein
MLDANGHLLRGAQPSREEAAPWVTAIRAQIDRLAR